MNNSVESAKRFEDLLRQRWFSQIRDIDVGNDVRKIIRGSNAPLTEQEFKSHLADAILNARFSMEEYEDITELDFETQEEVRADLMELWQQVFGDESIDVQPSSEASGHGAAA